ncbi:amino acid adenylation domain-containing protein isoform 3 [Cladophialophora immunda]|nr:amino acid adenylation domain-containing protein isoform 3 [Cladophialophora immunda]
MGSIQVDESDDRRLANGHSADILSTREADAEGFWSFKVAGLASDPPNTPTGLREDILLLAWLLVLLRTQDEGHVWFDWAYEARENGALHEPVKRRLAMDEFVTGLQDNIGQVGARIARHMTTCTQSQLPGGSGPVSLLLSTGSLSQTPEEANDQCILHLQVQFDEGRLKIRPVWQTENMLPYTMTRHVIALVDTVKMCLLNPDDPVKSVIRPTAADLDEIWKWNHPLPPSYNFCMHEVICQQAEIFKDKLAILSWDGSLTYAEVDRYSTSIAYSLKEMGVELHDVLPVCFEKSRWTIVAVLAVMKAGATFVLMDPTLPLARLQTMAKQVGAKTMLTSRKQHEYSAAILPDGNLMVVEEDSFKHIPCSQVMPKLTVVPPSTLMYIIFTSGSTGVPKGVLISHETYTSSAFPRAEAVGYTEHSRVLDFASYAFDVSIDSMLCTLSKGGCLCIPSDEDRMNDLNGAMRRMQVNYAGLTPSVARILDADVVASLSALGLGGEAATAREVTRWGQVTRIVIGYGPSECTIGCTVNSSAATGRDYVSLGRGNGAAIWIVDPTDHELLMPVGAVGELLVEGPIVGQGYLNDPDKTAAAFISDPLWLTAGHNGYEGRRGRLYKTGDLGKYDPDGSGGIVFIGRKDTQVKLRGQRVELGEIEYQLKARLPPGTNVIAEVIVPSGSGGQPTLMAFIAFQSMKGQESTDLQWAQPHKDLQEMLSAADAELAKVLPRYMVPTAYVPVNYIPVMISGKTDRKRLRQFGATFDLRQLDQATSNTAPRQLSDLEQLVRLAWSQTLQLDPETIRPDDNFFALGGDSLMAMKLVSGCRAQGLDVTVANIFRCPTLLAMADIVQTCSSQTRTETPAFSMISQDAETDASIDQGSTYPPAVVSWVCNPQNPSLLSPIGSIGELWLEGSFFAADNTSSPTWLLAGSSTCAGRSGTVQPTGDLVQLQDDSSLVFIGRKENRSTIQGHVMDIADLEAHVTNYLPSTTRAAAAVFQSPPDGNQQSAEHELVVFVEQQPSQEEHVPLMAAKHDITYDAPGPSRLHLTVHATIHLGLAIALKKLDKFIQDSLPPYMLPSAYIVVDKIPTEMGRPDHKLLNQIASRIPRSVLTTLQESLKEVWKTTTTQTSLTTPENIVRSAWAKILRISPEKIDLDDNFFRLGGDSVLAMKLASSLRVQGHTLTVADIFQNMKLRDAARVLRVDQVSVEKTPDYKPFSMLDGVDVGLFLSDVVRPKLADPRWSIQDVMPVTESQAIDVRATIQVPRTSIQYTMLYFEKGLNLDNLIRACNKLVTTHDILRTVFIEHESSLFQTVLDELESPVSTHQSEGDLEQYVVALCKTDIESDLRLGTPFLKMFHVKGPDGKGCLIIRLSHAQYDGISLPRLLRDLETLYAGGTVVDFRPFSAYMARVGDGRVKEPALNYWRTLLQGSKLSILEGPSAQHATRAMFLTKPVDAARRPAEITTASLLAGAWALVLARRLQQPDVTFGCITSGRNMDMPDVEKVMGPCYQFTPVRVPFEAGWTAMDLLRFVQRQSAESAANDFVGFGEILRSCNTQWSLPESSSSRHFFFDSVVHHQDFEDYDTMPFAGETCRVEIQNPHGDAAHPLKAVSFVQSGQTHVGVVGSERDQALIEALLAELAAAVEEVSAHRSEILRLNG